MSHQCPVCDAPVTDESLSASTLPVCPACGASLPIEWWRRATPDADDVLDELDIDWLDEMPASNSTQDDVTETESPETGRWGQVDLEEELASENLAAKSLELDDLDALDSSDLLGEAGLAVEDASLEELFEGGEDVDSPAPISGLGESLEETFGYSEDEPPFASESLFEEDDGELSTVPPSRAGERFDMRGDNSGETTSSTHMEQNKANSSNPPDPHQPFELAGPIIDSQDHSTSAKKPGPIRLLVRGVMLALGLILTIGLLQLACWWILRMDPLNAALMLPKSVAWLTPYSLTEDGRRAALQTQVRPTLPSDIAAADNEADVELDDESSDAPDIAYVPDSEIEETDTTTDDTGIGEAESPESEDEVAIAPTDSNPLATDPSTTDASEDEPFDFGGSTTDQDETAEEDLAMAEQPTPSDEPTPTTVEPVTPTDDNLGLGLGREDADDLFPLDGATEAEPLASTDAATPARESPWITNVPVYRDADVRAALNAATSLTESLNDAKRQRADVEQLRKIAKDFYVSCCELAETVTLSDSPSMNKEMSEARLLFSNLTQDAWKLRMIATTARGWIDRRLGNGVVLSGHVESITPVGRYQEVVLSTADGRDRFIVVIGDPDDSVANALMVGHGVLIGGYIVRDPESQLPGYATGESTVIWCRNLALETP